MRGKGRVVPRSGNQRANATCEKEICGSFGTAADNTSIYGPAAAAAAAAVQGASRASCPQSQASRTSTSMHQYPSSEAPPLAPTAPANTALQPKQQASSTSCGIEGADSTPVHPPAPCSKGSSSWRCAAQVQGGRPVELLAKELNTTKSWKLLSSNNQPVLLPGSNLATCRLIAADVNSSRGSTVSTTTTAAPAAPALPQQHRLAVLCSPAHRNRFLQADKTKTLLGSYYHLRKPETSVMHMSFQDWLHSWQSWKNSRLLLQVEVCTWQVGEQAAGAEPSHAATALAVAEDMQQSSDAGSIVRLWPNTKVALGLPELLKSTAPVPSHMPRQQQLTKPTTASGPPPSASQASQAAAAGGLQGLLDWQLLERLLADGQWTSAGSLHLWAGGHDALLPAKYDVTDRLVCQVSGRLQVLLLPPRLCFQGLYPYPVAHPYDGYSCVDWEGPELDDWPGAKEVTGLVCSLAPGDALLVPAYWFLHCQLQQPQCVSLTLQLHPRPEKLICPDALVVQLSRMIELWVAAEMGTANVRQWLLALAEGREWQLILKAGLTSVQGYKQLRVCHMILQQLQQVLSLQMPRSWLTFTEQISHTSMPGALGRAPSTLASAAVISSSSSPAISSGQGRSSTVLQSAEESVGPEGAASGPGCWSTAVVADGGPCCCRWGPMEREARRCLGDMCRERLMPTYWLNEGIDDQLYLQYQPEYYELEEDEEAIRYPQLFRHRLLANRPDWMDQAKRLTAIKGKLHAGSNITITPYCSDNQQIRKSC